MELDLDEIKFTKIKDTKLVVKVDVRPGYYDCPDGRDFFMEENQLRELFDYLKELLKEG